MSGKDLDWSRPCPLCCTLSFKRCSWLNTSHVSVLIICLSVTPGVYPRGVPNVGEPCCHTPCRRTNVCCQSWTLILLCEDVISVGSNYLRKSSLVSYPRTLVQLLQTTSITLKCSGIIAVFILYYWKSKSGRSNPLDCLSFWAFLVPMPDMRSGALLKATLSLKLFAFVNTSPRRDSWPCVP